MLKFVKKPPHNRCQISFSFSPTSLNAYLNCCSRISLTRCWMPLAINAIKMDDLSFILWRVKDKKKWNRQQHANGKGNFSILSVKFKCLFFDKWHKKNRHTRRDFYFCYQQVFNQHHRLLLLCILLGGNVSG